jgi:hypothetical protein
MCDCRQPKNCIIRNRKAYHDYYDQQYVIFKAGQITENTEIYEKSRSTSITVTHSNNKFDPFKSKCELAKQTIHIYMNLNETMDANHKFFNERSKLETQHDDLYTSSMRYKELLRKNIALVMESADDIKKYHTEIDDIRSELRTVKKENRKLKKAICHDENDNDNDNENDFIQPPVIKKIKGKFILQKYEQIKEYLARQSIGVNKLAKYCQQDAHLACSNFISLKMARIKISHPDYTKIKNDTEFFTILNTI